MTTMGGVLRLVRASLALSPMADGLAGASVALAAGAAARPTTTCLALFASLCLYLHGMAQNDLADRRKDSVGRPDRPLPSGAVSLTSASAVVISTGVLGVLTAFACSGATGWLSISILLSIALYNFSPAHMGCVGPLVLGAIRGQNLALGAVALGSPRVATVPAAIYAAYICAISVIARMEDEEIPVTIRRLILGLRFAAGAGAAAWLAMALRTLPQPPDAASAGLAGTALCLALGLATVIALVVRLESVVRACRHARPFTTRDVGRAVGVGLSSLFLVNASISFAAQQPLLGVIILMLFAVSRSLVSRFPPT